MILVRFVKRSYRWSNRTRRPNCKACFNGGRRSGPGAPASPIFLQKARRTRRTSQVSVRRGQGRLASGDPEELYPRLGFIISNLARPAEHVVAFYNQRDTTAQWVEEGKGRDQVDPAVSAPSPPTRCASSFMCRLQPRQLHTNAEHGSTTISLPHRHSSCPNWPSVSAREGGGL